MDVRKLKASTLDLIRRRRKEGQQRSRTIAPNKLTTGEVRQGKELAPWMHQPMPATRGDCLSGPRPCPFVRCKFHLYLDVNPLTGSVKLNFPDLDVDEIGETCVLDVVDRCRANRASGEATVRELAEIMDLTEERVRQIIRRALHKGRRIVRRRLHAFWD